MATNIKRIATNNYYYIEYSRSFYKNQPTESAKQIVKKTTCAASLI